MPLAVHERIAAALAPDTARGDRVGLIDDNADAAARLYQRGGLTEQARLLASGWVALRLERA